MDLQQFVYYLIACLLFFLVIIVFLWLRCRVYKKMTIALIAKSVDLMTASMILMQEFKDFKKRTAKLFLDIEYLTDVKGLVRISLFYKDVIKLLRSK